MSSRLFSFSLLFLLGFLAHGCGTFQTVGKKWDQATMPKLPREIYVNTVAFGPEHFTPWVPSNPFNYEGNYFGGSAGSLKIEIFGQDDGIQITGSRSAPTGMTPIAPTLLDMEYDPVFRTSGENGFLVNFAAPSAEPVPGIVLGNLFFEKEQPPPVEEEDERGNPYRR